MTTQTQADWVEMCAWHRAHKAQQLTDVESGAAVPNYGGDFLNTPAPSSRHELAAEYNRHKDVHQQMGVAFEEFATDPRPLGSGKGWQDVSGWHTAVSKHAHMV